MEVVQKRLARDAIKSLIGRNVQRSGVGVGRQSLIKVQFRQGHSNRIAFQPTIVTLLGRFKPPHHLPQGARRQNQGGRTAQIGDESLPNLLHLSPRAWRTG
jgi:hypothetical protein